MSARGPFTKSGWTALVIGVVSYVVGWRVGWIELMVLAAGCGLALAIAVPWIVGRHQLSLQRKVEPPRVTVGEEAKSLLAVTNLGKVSSVGRIIDEKINGEARSIVLKTLHAGETVQRSIPLPTDRRSVVKIGPAVVAKADPLGLMRREIAHNDEDVLYVNPRFALVRPLPVGFAKDLEGPTSDASPAGDVAFHTLREYQVGDDYRHIHWPSTARTGWLANPQIGSLMVRHYVDNRRPQMTIVLDSRKSAYASADVFERAVEAVASLVVSMLHHGQPVALRFGRDVILGQARPGNRWDVLDRLSAIAPQDRGDVRAAALHGLEGEIGTSALVVVTGGVPEADLMAIAIFARRTAHPIFVRLWPSGGVRPGAVPRAKLLDVDALASFQFAWNRTVA